MGKGTREKREDERTFQHNISQSMILPDFTVICVLFVNCTSQLFPLKI